MAAKRFRLPACEAIISMGPAELRACGRVVFAYTREQGMHMNRRTCLSLLAAAIAAGGAVDGKDIAMLRALLEASQNDKKGVTLWVKGQVVGGAVTKIDAEWVELRSREYSRIVVKIESIDGAAMA
jgi:hypothetical protein